MKFRTKEMAWNKYRWSRTIAAHDQQRPIIKHAQGKFKGALLILFNLIWSNVLSVQILPANIPSCHSTLIGNDWRSTQVYLKRITIRILFKHRKDKSLIGVT